jgi:hypothetical protein
MRITRTSVFALLAIILLAPMISFALAATVRYYSATIDPTSVNAGDTISFTVTVTNDLSTTSTQTIKSATVAIPSGFTGVAITDHTPSTWSASLVSGVIYLYKIASVDISPGQSLSVTFTATAPTTPGPYTFYTYAYGGTDYTADYTLVGSQPVVTVIGGEVDYNYETAFAYDEARANDFLNSGFSRWGWTIGPLADGYSGEWELWAAAGQSNFDNGMLVGTADVTYSGGTVTVDFNLNAGVILVESHVYAGTAMFPLDHSGNPTVAPGQYTNPTGLTGDIYVIVHAIVGIPVT